jgi:glycine/D-amino acid oxidase-like deaminating enzyme
VFQREGGRYLAAAAQSPNEESTSLRALFLHDGSSLEADGFVLACGPWLPEILPGVLANAIQPTRQEIFYFGEPGPSGRFADTSMPAWVDHGDTIWYGSPGNETRGFKIGDDSRGPVVDPTSQDRIPTPMMVERTRAYAAHRFPELAKAPILEARVCQYENTPDNDFILDRHPNYDNVWIAGGGSGHGFKHGPAIGEYVSALVVGRGELREEFRLNRFTGQSTQ